METNYKGLNVTCYSPFLKNGTWNLSSLNKMTAQISFKTGSDEERVNTLRLISAAQPLLEVCQELNMVLDPLVNNPVHEDVMKRLRSAISLALNNK